MCGALAEPTEADLLPQVEAIARAAGALILEVYGTDFDVTDKADASPVTLADERAEALITPALQSLRPAWPVVAEEAAARGEAPAAAPCFWLVDPLDGTREFVARNGEFTVNIALVRDGRPVLGVVYLPVPERLYAGIVGQGAWCEQGGQRVAIAVRSPPAGGPVVACSRSHGDDAAMKRWLQGRPVSGWRVAGSSLKFGLIAEGAANLYPRLCRTMEWDTAAGDAVLTAAGGSVCDLAGQPLRYGKPGFENPHFVACGAAAGRPG
ncbi:MAG: 3'(2'),5'-bisphosphate nucleotidase [Leptothrix sp. (in: Bacteria)]|nr:3'(2'),5'-bisphosphate nucleotidase [Leptothrix sp. (in: b-proteobacteria)]